MPFDWTGVPPAVGAVAAVVAALMKLYRDRRSCTAALEAPHEDVSASSPTTAGRVPFAVRVEVSGPSRVRVAVTDGGGLVLVDVVAVDPGTGPSRPSAKERAPW
ncbi:hypothetical protein AB0N28_01090 [Streptomyces sp. NPDC051130]|uniref:hypothetical protein n=1 Tax=Streptomyces sp. NPDC051130 TaxID=3157223 RepID=UPI0034323BB4